MGSIPICIILPCLNSNDNWSQIAALGTLFHVADKDFEIGGYLIPKDSTIMAVIRPIMYDEKVSVLCRFLRSLKRKAK